MALNYIMLSITRLNFDICTYVLSKNLKIQLSLTHFILYGDRIPLIVINLIRKCL